MPNCSGAFPWYGHCYTGKVVLLPGCGKRLPGKAELCWFEFCCSHVRFIASASRVDVVVFIPKSFLGVWGCFSLRSQAVFSKLYAASSIFYRRNY